MTDDLVTWLRAQLNDDERVARATEATLCPEWVGDFREVFTADDEAQEVVSVAWSEGVTTHIARHDPQRVLAEVDAKRRILAEHLKAEYRDECRRCFDPDTAPGDYDFETFPCPTLRALALPYADRPGYREEWKPQVSASGSSAAS